MVPFWGRCPTHFRTYFSGDRDVHWGYGILTHGHVFRCHDTHSQPLANMRHAKLPGAAVPSLQNSRLQLLHLQPALETSKSGQPQCSYISCSAPLPLPEKMKLSLNKVPIGSGNTHAKIRLSKQQKPAPVLGHAFLLPGLIPVLSWGKPSVEKQHQNNNHEHMLAIRV